MVARSPGHVTHETNSALLERLALRHPFDMLHKISTVRLESCRAHLHHLQPAVVQQWWDLLASNFATLVQPGSTCSHLVDVTQQVAFQYQCPHCPQAFPTFHSLIVHLGKSHSTQQPRKDKNPTLKNKRRDDYRVHSLNGMPQCKHCLPRFHAWPQFMGHVDQRACEGLQAAYATSESQHAGSGKLKSDTSSQGALAPGGVSALEHDILPLLHRPEMQSLARQQQPKTLAAAVRQANCSNHCPECYQWCTSHSYVVKHAVKMHASIQQAQARVAAWVQARTCIQRPCEWCGEWFKARPKAHIKSCPVLWTCGHFLFRFGTLEDRLQPKLQHAFDRSGGGGAAERPERTGPVRLEHADGIVHSSSLGDQPGGERHGSGCFPGQAAGHLNRGASTQVGQRGCQGRSSPGGQPGDRERTQSGSQPQDSSQRGHSDGGGSTDVGRNTVRTEAASRGTPDAEPEIQPPGRVRRQDQSSRSSYPNWGRNQGGQGPAGSWLQELRRRHQGPGQSGSTPKSSARRPTSHHGSRHGLHVFPSIQQVWKRQIRDRCVVQDCARLEPAEGKRAAHAHAADEVRATLLSAEHAAEARRGSGDGCGIPDEGEGAGAGDKRSLSLPALGRRAAKACALPSGASGAQGSGGSDQAGSPLDGLSWRGREVPCHSQPDREGTGRSDSVQSSGAEPHPGEPSNVGLHEPPCPLQLLALDSWHHETGQAWPQPASQDHPATSSRLLSLSPSNVLNLVLTNSSNMCYANSGVLAVLWSIASTQQGLHLLRLLQWLTRKPQRVSLPSLRVWQSITFDWQEPHSQHDAAEFLGFLRPALVSTSDAGKWEARVSVDPSTPDALPHQVVDHGQMWPLVLATALSPAAEGANREEWTLQSLIIRWRNLVVQHAAVTSPPILPLQLNRFGQDGNKVLSPIALSPTVFFPCFTGQGTNTQSVQYQLAAVQYHLGQTPLSGHYRTAFFSRGAPVYTTDDNRSAQACTDSDIDSIRRNVMMVLRGSEGFAGRAISLFSPHTASCHFVKCWVVQSAHEAAALKLSLLTTQTTQRDPT